MSISIIEMDTVGPLPLKQLCSFLVDFKLDFNHFN